LPSRTGRSATELELLHEKLIERRAEVLDRRERRLREADRTELARIDAALERIQHGTYGLDIETGEPIGFARLLAVPWVLRTTAHDTKRGAWRTAGWGELSLPETTISLSHMVR
jgi:RNA polymerase-binding transcription factor DksA